MAVTANSIITPQTPKSNRVNVATANTTFTTSPTNTQLLITAGANGARVTKIHAIPCENVTASNLQVYRQASGSSNKYLAMSQTCGPDTVSGTDGAFSTDFGLSDDSPMILTGLEEVYVATGISKSFNFIAEWADY
jgi:hypothetical protein